MSEIVFSPTIEAMPASDNVQLGLVMQTEPDFLTAGGPDDLAFESSGISLTFSPEPASVTFSSFVGLGDEYVWYCPTLETIDPWNCITSGINLNLTPQNATVTSDQDGEAYSFTGSSSSYATNFARVTDQDQFSYSFWVNGPASSDEVEGVVGQSSINNLRGALVGAYQNSSQGGDGSKATFFYQSNPSSYNPAERLQSFSTVFDSAWHHVVVTFQGGSRAKIYIDGVLDNTKSSSVPSQVYDGYQFEIGRYAGSNGFSGSVDDVRVFTRVLTAAEVSWLATARGVQGSGPPPSNGLGDEKLWLCPSISSTGLDISSYERNTDTKSTVIGLVDGENAYKFNSSTSVLSGYTAPVPNSVASYSGWIAASASPSSTKQVCVLAERWPNTTASAVNFAFNVATSGNITPMMYDGTKFITGNELSKPVGSMFHYAMIWYRSLGYAEIYIDGLYQYNFTDVFSGTYSANQCQVNKWDNGAFGGSDVYMDDIRAFERALTADEISWLATERGVLGGPSSDDDYSPFLNSTFQSYIFSSKVIR